MHLSFKDRSPVRRLSVRISNPYAKAPRRVADGQLRHLNEYQAKAGAGRNRHPGAARPAPLGDGSTHLWS